MSAKLMGYVWDLALPRSERDVLLAMADHADDAGNSVRPSVDHLAWKTDYSERQVQRAIISLKAKRIIEVVADDEGGRGKATAYHLCLHRAPKKRPWKLVQQEKLAARRKKKGDMASPAEMDDMVAPNPRAGKGDIDDTMGDAVSPIQGEKGDIRDAERVTSGAQKGDIRGSSLYSEPVKEPSREPKTPLPPAPVAVAEPDEAPERKAPAGADIPKHAWAPFYDRVGEALGVSSYTKRGTALGWAGALAGQFGKHAGHDVDQATRLFDAFVAWAKKAKYGSGKVWTFVNADSICKHAGKYLADNAAAAIATADGGPAYDPEDPTTWEFARRAGR